MRTLLALTALVSAFHTSSDACGWMPPTVEIHRVADHAAHGFVVLGAAPEVTDNHWLALQPRSYDGSQVAELSWLPTARELTLLGYAGTRVVSADHQVALREWGARDRAFTALEVPNGFELAIDGRAANVAWHPIELTYSRTQKIRGLKMQVRYEKDGFSLLADGKVVQAVQGSFMGFLDRGRDRFLVVAAKSGDPEAIYFGAAV